MNGAQSRPDFTGVWVVKFDKSTLRGQAPKEIVMKIDHREPSVLQQMNVTYEDGRKQRLTFEYRTTGEETRHAAGGTARSRARWEDAELVIESSMKTPDRAFHFRDHWSLSNDGCTLTMAHRNDDLDGQISVLEKAPQREKEFD